jgi:ATP-binding cassette subfamily C (CFTR/MRP) protein 1
MSSSFRPILERSISMSCDISVEDRFGPQVKGCLGDFDFTLLFEETILSITLVALALSILWGRIWHLLKQPRKVNGGRLLQGAKFVNTPISIFHD